MPAPPARVEPADFVRLSQLYARHAEVTNERGERHETATWSEIDTAQWMARQPRARAWFRVPRAALGERVRDRSVGEMVEAAEAAGAPVRREPEHVTVETVAGITTTLGGLTIDAPPAPPRACSPAGPTPAASRPAATRAGWPPRSCSAASRPGRRWGRARDGAALPASGPAQRARCGTPRPTPASPATSIASAPASPSRSGWRRSCCSWTPRRCSSPTWPTASSPPCTSRGARRARGLPGGDRGALRAAPHGGRGDRRHRRGPRRGRAAGGTPMAVGLHPDARFGDVSLVGPTATGAWRARCAA